MSKAGRMIMKGDWKKSLAVVHKYGKTAHRAIDLAVYQEAHYYLQLVNKAFVQGGLSKKWPRLNKITLAMRRSKDVSGSAFGGTKPLIRSGSLRRSLNVRKEGYGQYFVGVHRTAKRGGYNAKKFPLVDIARIHEHGAQVVVTDKMRGYFQYLASKGIIKAPLKKSTRVLIIPQRSFINQGMDEWRPGHEVRLLKRVSENMGIVQGSRTSSGGTGDGRGPSSASGTIG